MTPEQLAQVDRDHLWHPYSSPTHPPVPYLVVAAEGVRLRLADGRELIDGMASWWSVIHGYNHPRLNAAIEQQLGRFAHVMFGGLTHEPAARLAEQLIKITPAPLTKVFFSDSGSVAVEVALKMALQYWYALGRRGKTRFVALRNAYHGDTFGAMSVCDPVTGMHNLYQNALPRQLFAPAPQCRFEAEWQEEEIAPLRRLLEQQHQEIAALILEPIVQGAGGMWFYSPHYLRRARELCDEFEVLLIADEIATGFGRTGTLFACEHAAICPDILCIGKALTGGYLSLAATLTTAEISDTIGQGEPGVFMHGPTFMANPLACAVAHASIELLLAQDWRATLGNLERQMLTELAPARALDTVRDVRVLGGIGVIELQRPVKMEAITPELVARGVWIRPFRRLLYVMPPYMIAPADLSTLTLSMTELAAREELLHRSVS